MSKGEAERQNEKQREISLGKVLRCRIRYFTDGAVIGSRNFVDEAFTMSRERFGKNRKSRVRQLRGEAAAANGMLWSLRDLRRGIG
jgi:putative transposase